MSCTEFNFVEYRQDAYLVRQFSAGIVVAACGSRPSRLVFNVQDLLKMSFGIEAVDVHWLVPSKQIKLVQGEAILCSHDNFSPQGLGFWVLFQQGLRQIRYPITVHVG